MKKSIDLICRILLNRPFAALSVLIAVAILSFFLATKLTINSNQIDLLSPDYPEVAKAKKVIEMIGGQGFFIIVLKSKDEKGVTEHLYKSYKAKHEGNLELYKKEQEAAKKARLDHLSYYKNIERVLKTQSDILNARLLKEPEVRYISYRWDTSFVKDRLPLYIQPEDLKKTHSRVKRKIDEEIEKLNPFFIKMDKKEYNPDFTDIISKYQKMAKRDIFDEYNISSDKGMLLMLVKPKGAFTDIGYIRVFEGKVREVIKELKLEEKGLRVGYTGTYKLSLDDYDSLVNALKPVSIASLLGIAILLLIFFRNPLFISILLISLVSGILFTFGATYVVVGRLNTITSIMAAILMGLGIDYGIQFLYRFREEFSKDGDLIHSVKETVYHTGIASLSSALTTTSAFVVLMFSKFRGFSEFGLIACYGIILIAMSMYFVTALQIAIILKLFPESKKWFYLKEKEKEVSPSLTKLFAKPGFLFSLSICVILIISLFGFRVKFNYSGRDLLLENQESLLLYDEIGDRFDISSDPQAIVVDTLEESEAVFDYFTPVPEHMRNSVDQVVALWNFVPSDSHQKENRRILGQINKDISRVKTSFLKPEQRKYMPTIRKYLSVKQVTHEDVPEYFRKQFKEIPASKEKGHLLFIYPKMALWHGHDLFNFHNAVGEFEFPLISKRTMNSILYSKKNSGKTADGYNPIREDFTREEERLILQGVNTYSGEMLSSIGVLPGTVKLILDKRPFESIKQLRSHKGKANTAGSVILFARLAKIVQSEGFIAFFVTLAIVTLILLVFYRSIVAAVLSLFPLLIGILVMLGIMGLSGQKINFMNILVFPIVIGYGIQNGIYMYYRFLEEKNIATALSKVGPAILASTLTTLVGWSVLLLAEHRGLHSLGVVASIGIGSSLVVAFTLLPALLALIYKNNKKDFPEPDSWEHPIEDASPKPVLALEETKVKKTVAKKKTKSIPKGKKK